MTTTSRFQPLRRLLLAGLVTTAAGLAHAQGTTPTLRSLVGFPPGGGTDAIARVLADKMKDVLNQPVIVENRAGAGGQIAAHALKAAAPDGTTVFLSHDHSISILPLVTKNAGFDPAADFVPVAGFATFANGMAVSGGTPAKSVAEYVEWVKASKGGKDTIGVPAPGSIPEFMVGLIAKKYGLDLQAAPYRGSAPMMADMLGNQISSGMGSVPDFIENQKAGKIRMVAVIGDKRQAILPDVPTFAELGVKGLEDLPYYGLFAPAGTPPAQLERIGQALQRVIAMPDVNERLTGMGLTVGYQAQAPFARRVTTYTQTWAKIIRDSGFQPK
jgi:tripartite-type tricarboxylate transporter receptor subunit TctC